MAVRKAEDQSMAAFCNGCATLVAFDTSDIQRFYAPAEPSGGSVVAGCHGLGARAVHHVFCPCGAFIEVKGNG